MSVSLVVALSADGPAREVGVRGKGPEKAPETPAGRGAGTGPSARPAPQPGATRPAVCGASGHLRHRRSQGRERRVPRSALLCGESGGLSRRGRVLGVSWASYPYVVHCGLDH